MTLHPSSEEWFEDFEKRASAGDNETILNLLGSVSVLNTHDNEGNSLLHYVARTNNKSIMVHLLSIGCSVNVQNLKRESPLVTAILFHNIEIAEILIDAGADHVNANFYGKFGPLHYAADKGYSDMVKLLLKAGADAKAVNVGHRSPLHTAIATEYKDNFTDRREVVKTLIEAGCDINAKDESDETPLHHAINYGQVEVLELLLGAGADVHATDFKFPPLHRCIEKDNLRLAQRLIDAGANVNWRDKEGRTCLHWAAAWMRPGAVKLLLDNGASVNVCDEKDLDPLCYGLKVRGDELNEQLCLKYDRYADHNNDDQIERIFPDTPDDQLECIRLFLKRGANINRVNKEGLTALYITLLDCNHSQVVRYLLNSGATFDPKHAIVQEVIKNENGSKFPYLLLKHAALFQVQNPKSGSWKFELKSVNGYLLKKHYEDCKKELESMKTSWIYGSVTFFSILKDQDIGPYVRDEHLDTAFVKQFASKKFPIYCDILVERFSRLMEKRKPVKTNSKNSCAVM